MSPFSSAFSVDNGFNLSNYIFGSEIDIENKEYENRRDRDRFAKWQMHGLRKKREEREKRGEEIENRARVRDREE